MNGHCFGMWWKGIFGNLSSRRKSCWRGLLLSRTKRSRKPVCEHLQVKVLHSSNCRITCRGFWSRRIRAFSEKTGSSSETARRRSLIKCARRAVLRCGYRRWGFTIRVLFYSWASREPEKLSWRGI